VTEWFGRCPTNSDLDIVAGAKRRATFAGMRARTADTGGF